MATATALTELKGNVGVRAHICRFAPQFRNKLWRLSAVSPRTLDLIFSFPAAAVAIVSATRADPRRKKALQLVADGASRLEVCAALEIPYWYRRLPPEAFIEPILGVKTVLPCMPEFGASMINLLPREPWLAGRWFSAVSAARELGGEEFALWCGQLGPLRMGGRARVPLLALALYAYFSRHKKLEAARMIGTPWSPSIGLGRSAGEVRRWLMGLLDGRPAPDVGSGVDGQPQWASRGLQILALDSAARISDEARQMRNCLRQYIGLVAWGNTRLFSIRKDGVRVANFEVRLAVVDGRCMPSLREIRGPLNMPVSEDVLAAAQSFIASHAGMLQRELGEIATPQNERLFQALVWQPFVQGREAAGARLQFPTPTLASILRDAQGLYVFEK